MYQIDFSKPIHVYFAGIGGISMSGLAEILLSRGFKVSGSDRAQSAITDRLSANGIQVFIGQKEENITPDIDLAVFTAAIHPDNPEYIAVEKLNIPMMSRAELLGQIMKNYRVPVAVAGTHGKTTTTSMLSEVLVAADEDPTLSVGGILPSIGGNVRVGHSDYFVAEACEYTNSFLQLFPQIEIILNVDADHLDFFKDLDDIRHSFRRFAELLPSDGALILNSDIPDYHELTEGLSCRVITYGPGSENLYYPSDIRYDEAGHPVFILNRRNPDGTVFTCEIALHVPGEHNVYNAIAAFIAADLIGVDPSITAKALGGYHGTDRRFELKGKINGITIIDDYAHHPTEIAATLRAAHNYPHERVICVFQPHTYTRTKALLPEFANALTDTDLLVVADIYAARETDTLGISSKTLQQEVRNLGHECYHFPSFEEIEQFLLANCREGDLLITMGAGNVNKIGEDLLSSQN